MTNPVYKIETYTGAVLDHTITNEIRNIQFKETLTDAIGSFSFTVPTKKNGGYYYDDIALHDKVKIYLGYDSVPANPNFIGRVTTISGPLSMQQGYIRIVSGFSQGEILLRRQKTNKHWNSTGASTIATDIANDLSLGTGDIDAEVIQEDIEVDTETYFNLLQRMSDYWNDATHQVKYDFYVDTDNDLVWKARPIRTAGVETLTVGKNLLHYNVTRDVNSVKNNINIYGKAKKLNPTDGDSWTEATTNWVSDGTLSADATDYTTGTKSVQTTRAATSTYMRRSITSDSLLYPKDPQFIHFWLKVKHTVCNASYTVHLYAPDSSNYFVRTYWRVPNDEWVEYQIPTGKQSKDFTTGAGSPDWSDIQAIHFYSACAGGGTITLWVDNLYFGGERFSGSASDATSQTNYGQRDLEVIDDRLTTDTMCSQRAEKLLYQLKDPPTYILVTTPGNTNILIGDRLSMTIPAENINAANYDVYEVTQMLDAQQGFLTKALMIDSGENRISPVMNPTDAMVKLHNALKRSASGQRFVY